MPIDEDMKSTVICHVHYRQPNQWFTSTNVSLELVKMGQAWVNASGMVVPLSAPVTTTKQSAQLTKIYGSKRNHEENKNDTHIMNFIPTVKQLQKDAEFMSQLEQAEFSSWKSKVGMWSSPRARELRREYLEEEKLLKSRLSSLSGFWGWLKKEWQ